jgi:glycosyltransferase 2 family protein
MFLNIIFIDINLDEFYKSWHDLNYFLIIPAVGFVILGSVIQAIRWKIILTNLSSFKFTQLFPSVLIGHMANHILPAKAGEFIKCYYLGKKTGCSKIAIFSTIVIERVFDGIMILSFLIVFIFGISKAQSELVWMGVLGAILYGVVFLFLLFIIFQVQQIDKLIKFLLPQKISQIAVKYLHTFSEGLQILKEVKQLARIMILSIIMWLVIAVALIPLIWMFNFELPFYTSFALLACIALGLSIPSAPGGIGIVSFATIFSLKIIFVESGQTISNDLYTKIVTFSLLSNIVMALPEIVLGLTFTIRENFSLFTIEKTKDDRQ